MTYRPNNTVLVTGATGFLGHYVFADLCRRARTHCRVLLRSPLESSKERLAGLLSSLGLDLKQLVQDHRMSWMEGDLTSGIDPSGLAGVNTVIHVAGNTSFEARRDGEPFRTNVHGTRALLGAATAAGVGHFLFISTAYVCGTRKGLITERVEMASPRFNNDYEESKWQAEQLAWEWAAAGRTATICRPGILFGDCVNGRVTNYGGIYLVARATEILARAVEQSESADRHRIPLRILGDPNATSNLVPVDRAAGRIVDILLDSGLHGRVHHLTNARPPTHQQIKAWLEEYFDVAGGRFSDEPWPLRDPNHLEELFYSLGNVVRDYFRVGVRFESHWDREHPMNEPSLSKTDFHRSLRYAQAHNWGRGRKAVTGPGRTVDPEWYFQRFLPQWIPRSRVADVHALTGVVRFCIGSSPRGWVCRFSGGRLACVQATSNGTSAEFGFWVSERAFAKLVCGRESLQAAFFRGDADVMGNVEQALRMVPIMSEFIREHPVARDGGQRV